MIVFKDLPWYYVEMLDWREDNGIVKAFPKKSLSDKAHREILKAFKEWGGKFVSWNGQSWYEIPLDKYFRSVLTVKET